MDLHTEDFRTFRLPEEIVASSGCIRMFSISDNRLCVADFRQCSRSYVWVLVEEDRWERILGSGDARLMDDVPIELDLFLHQ
ncbi:unnamed protein product [Cochlearia groenlandica]